MQEKRWVIGISLVLLLLLLPSLLFAQSTSRGRSRRSANYELTVNANVKGYQVHIDGNAIKGNKVTLKPGQHTVLVKAKGYFDWQESVNVDSDQTINATLRPIEYRLTVNSNIKGAKVYIDGNSKGTTGYSENLKPGTYKVLVSQYGYQDYTTTVNLNQNREINANLQPAYARVQVRFSTSILNSKDKGAEGKVEIYVDGNRQNGRSFQLMPGEHTIQIISGGFSVQQSFNFNPGQNYTVEPNMGLSIQ